MTALFFSSFSSLTLSKTLSCPSELNPYLKKIVFDIKHTTIEIEIKDYTY